MKKPRNAPAESNESGDGSCYFCEPASAGISQLLRLSERQVEILQCLLLGDDEGAAAEFLGISADTVHTHLKRLHGKLAVHSRITLIVRLFDAHRDWWSQASAPSWCPLKRRLVRIE